MHDTRPGRRIVGLALRLEQPQQPIGQRTAPVAVGGMRYHALRLIEHDDARVLIQYIELQLLGGFARVFLVLEDDAERVAGLDRAAKLASLPSQPRTERLLCFSWLRLSEPNSSAI